MKHYDDFMAWLASQIEKKNPLKQGLKRYIRFVFGCIFHIEKKNPLKQGLKQYQWSDRHSLESDWKEESIKTRIETGEAIIISSNPYKIEKKNPLKQGLKLTKTTRIMETLKIEKKNPLKQGLKPTSQQFSMSRILYWKEESIKTRIETKYCHISLFQDFELKRRIH